MSESSNKLSESSIFFSKLAFFCIFCKNVEEKNDKEETYFLFVLKVLSNLGHALI